MSGGTSSGGRGRWLIVALALAICGAAAGAWAGGQIAPEEPEVTIALAVAGFGLGGLIGMLALGLRALLLGAIRLLGRLRDAAAPASRATTAPAAPPSPPPDPQPESASEPEARPAAAPEPTPASAPEPEPEPLPAPPAGQEPGWYPDPQHPGRTRFWDGRTWTAHVSRDRESRSRRGVRPRR